MLKKKRNQNPEATFNQRYKNEEPSDSATSNLITREKKESMREECQNIQSPCHYL